MKTFIRSAITQKQLISLSAPLKVLTQNLHVRSLALLFAVCSLGALESRAQNFTAGNLAVFSADAVANNATFSIVEVNPSTAGGSAVQTIAINGTFGGNALRCSGSAGTTGFMATSKDGTLLCFTGHNTTSTSGNINAVTARGVGTLNYTGAFTLQTTYTGIGGNQTRCATSLNNGTWYVADQGGLYTNASSAASTTTNPNPRSVKVFGSTVYGFAAASIGTFSSATATSLTALPGVTISGASDFYMVSSGSTGTTFDILYIVSNSSATAGTILKFSLVSGTWTANGSYTTNFGGLAIVANKQGNGANLYVTGGDGATGGKSLIKLNDAAGHNAAINITTASNVTLYTASASSVIKGIAFAPVIPKPVVTAGTPPTGITGNAYSYTVEASNSPTSFVVATGALPTGLSINNSGVISGTPTAVGPFTAGIAVTNSTGTSDTVNFSFTINSSVITLTMSGASVTSKTYDGTTNASVVAGTLVGIDNVNYPNVTVSGTTGTYSSANAGTGISVTPNFVLSGSDAGQYVLTQPSLTGDINKANQSISFSALTTKILADADFSPGASSATSGTNPITYISSNTGVATIVSGNIHIVRVGTSTITASQASSTNYNAASDQTQTLTVLQGGGTLATYDCSALVSTNPNPAFLPATQVASNLTGSSLTFAGIGQPSGGQNLAINYNNIPASFNAANYVTFTMTPAAGYQQTLTAVRIGANTNSGGNGNTKFSLRSSLDNYASDLVVSAFLTGATSTATYIFTSSFQDQGPITFRIYPWSTGGGNFRIAKNTVDVRTLGIEVDGTVSVSPPSLTIGALNPGTSFTAAQGTPSSAQTFSVTGAQLTSDLTIGPLSGYEFSDNGSAYSSSLTYSTTSISKTVSVRLTGASGGTFSGNINIASVGAPGSPKTIAVTGTVYAYVPGSLGTFNVTGLATLTGTTTPPYLTPSAAIDSGTVNDVYPQRISGTANVSNISFVGLFRKGSLIPGGSNGSNYYNTKIVSGANPPIQGGAFDPNKYLEFQVIPAAGYTLNLTNLRIANNDNGSGTGSTVNMTYALRSSLDNYASNITTWTSNSVIAATNITLPAAFQSIPEGAGVKFRIYGYNGQNGASTYRIAPFIGTISTKGIEVDGSITSLGTTIWNGTSWSNGIPTSTMSAVINGTYGGSAITVKNLTISSSATIASGSVITVTGVLTNNGTLTIANGAGLVQGSVSTLAGLGTYKVQKAATNATGYTYWSTPVDIAAQRGSSVNTYYYKEDAHTLGNINTGWKKAIGNMEVGKGYTGTVGTTTQIFTGTINNGAKSTPVTYTDLDHNPLKDGWNLIGNPYPSTIDIASLLSANNGVLNAGVYFWSSSANNYLTRTTGNIPVGQGYFVNAFATGDVNFMNAMRTIGTTAMYRTDSENEQIILNISDGVTSDETEIGLNANATDAYDRTFDAYKFKGNDVLQLYSKITDNNYDYAINVLGAGDNKQVQLAYDAKNVGTYTISINTNSASIPVVLEDKVLNTTHDLSQGDYTFSNGGLANNTRFVLHLAPSVTSIESTDLPLSSNNLIVSTQDRVVNVMGMGDLEVSVMDMNGTVIATGKGNNVCRIALNQVSTGIYLVKANSVNTNAVRKIVVE